MASNASLLKQELLVKYSYNTSTLKSVAAEGKIGYLFLVGVVMSSSILLLKDRLLKQMQVHGLTNVIWRKWEEKST